MRGKARRFAGGWRSCDIIAAAVVVDYDYSILSMAHGSIKFCLLEDAAFQWVISIFCSRL